MHCTTRCRESVWRTSQQTYGRFRPNDEILEYCDANRYSFSGQPSWMFELKLSFGHLYSVLRLTTLTFFSPQFAIFSLAIPLYANRARSLAFLLNSIGNRLPSRINRISTADCLRKAIGCSQSCHLQPRLRNRIQKKKIELHKSQKLRH